MRVGSKVFSASAALLLTLASWPALAVTNVFYSGHATGISGTVRVGSTNASVLISDNQMSCNGVPQEEDLANVTNPSPLKITARAVGTYTLGRDNTATATADIADLNIAIPDLTIKASALSSRAQVHCDFVPTHSNPTGLRGVYKVEGGADIGQVYINGKGTSITGEPNQTIEIPGVATIIFNEQVQSSRSLIVSAMHVKVLDDSYPASGDLVFAYSRAKLTCESV